MIEITLGIRRRFWTGFTASAVDEHLNELLTSQKRLKNFGWEYETVLFGSNKLLKSIENIITDEIKYCEFYIEHQKIKTDVNFQKWIFTKKEDIKPLREWMTPDGDQWTRSNGRIKATIEIDRRGIMTKLTLFYQNDSQYLNFNSSSSSNPVIKSHLRNEDSINNKIIEMKAIAETYQREHQLPIYTLEEKNNYTYLENLLCIESCTGGDPSE